MIDAQAEMALSSEGFTEIDGQTMRTIMERETLNCRYSFTPLLMMLVEVQLSWIMKKSTISIDRYVL